MYICICEYVYLMLVIYESWNKFVMYENELMKCNFLFFVWLLGL